jgi:hypothetical protein
MTTESGDIPMILNTISQISYGKMQFFNEDGSLAFYANIEKGEKGNSSIKIFNFKNEMVSEVFYIENKLYASRKFEVKRQSGDSFGVILKGNDVLIDCKERELRVTRSFFDRKICLYYDNILIMCMKSKRFFRPWLCGKYSLKITDNSDSNLCVTIAMIMFKVLYDGYTLASSSF